jgi:hypothetical protein
MMLHAHTYTVPRSVEHQLQQSKKIVRLVDIGVLVEIVQRDLEEKKEGVKGRKRFLVKLSVKVVVTKIITN